MRKKRKGEFFHREDAALLTKVEELLRVKTLSIVTGGRIKCRGEKDYFICASTLGPALARLYLWLWAWPPH